MELRTHDRYDYVPLRGRADYSWPAGRRLAVYFALNLEHFSYGEGLGAELAPGGPHPDILNYAWRDYGNRVGAWYMLDAFDALRLPMAALVNSAMYDYAPELVAACRARGDEIVGHGRTNAERQGRGKIVFVLSFSILVLIPTPLSLIVLSPALQLSTTNPYMWKADFM